VVTVKLNSSYECLLVNDVLSAGVTMHMATVFVPVVDVSANTGTSVSEGTEVTFTATVSNAGTAPTYQWLINSKEIAGAVQNTYMTSNLKDGDSVTCRVHGTGDCSKTSINSVVMEVTPSTGVTMAVLP
jgi:2-keto-4-pentenoate hydratase/2-oxohepta-3-ene-1,7-dioic acid hydratase in catechol pathway